MTQAGSMAGVWHVVQVKPNQTGRARINLERQGLKCFMPDCLVSGRVRGRVVTKTRPLFPGYLFVQPSPTTSLSTINSTFGVLRLIMRDTHTAQPVPADVMRHLMSHTDAAGLFAPCPNLSEGDSVRITNGPMVDLVARVEQLRDADRVDILLDMMGQAVRLEVPRSQLERERS